MRLRIEHTTTFAYDSAIAEAYTELRLRPLNGSGQHCSSFRVATEPPGVRTASAMVRSRLRRDNTIIASQPASRAPWRHLR